MKTLLFYLSKGGVAKTTSAFNVAWVFAEKFNKKVLVIDLDAEQHMSHLFGFEPDESDCNTIANAMIKELNPNRKRLPITDCIYKVEGSNNIDVAISSKELAQANVFLLKELNYVNILKKQLDTIKDKYDICILDCASASDVNWLNAIVASDYVIPTIQTNFLSVDALRLTQESFNDLKEQEVKFDILGVICTLYRNTNHDKQCLDIIKEDYNVLGVINNQIAVPDSGVEGLPVFKYNKSCQASLEYDKISKELIKLMEE